MRCSGLLVRGDDRSGRDGFVVRRSLVLHCAGALRVGACIPHFAAM